MSSDNTGSQNQAGDASADTIKDTVEDEGTSVDPPHFTQSSSESLPSAKTTDTTVSQENELPSNETKSSDSPEQGTDETLPKEMVDFKVVYNKKKLDVSFPLDDTVSSLRDHLEKLTGVPAAMQKIMFKGKMRDESTLREHDVKRNAKIMLIGSTVNDVMSVSAPDPKVLKEEEKKAVAASKQPLCKQKPHVTVLEKHGKPDDAMAVVKGSKQPLPPTPLAGMYNKNGGKVRLTFKLEQDQLWIGTKERTDKIPMGSIKAVVSEGIEGHDGYHMMAFQLGPTEASRYWVYWVPAQYVDAIKDSVLGKWQFF